MRRILFSNFQGSYFLIFFLLSYLSYAQVVIKDRVEIEPQVITPYSSLESVEHIFTYTMTWTADENQDTRGNIQIVDCNGDTINSGWSTGGIVTISFPANGRHHYLYQPQRYFYKSFVGYGWYDDVLPDQLLKEYVDGIDLNHFQSTLGSYNGVAGNFNFNLNGTLCPSDYTTLSINNIQWADCNGANWYETDPVNLQITEGQEYASFFDINTGTDLGNTIQLLHNSDISNIGLRKNETAPSVSTIQPVKIEANINGVAVVSETEYYPESYIIDTDLYLDSITTGESTYIDIYFDGYCSGLPMETKVNVEIVEGTEYGSLIDPDTYEKTKMLTNLDHWFGYLWVEYIAEGKSHEETDSVVIKISTTDPDIDTANVVIYIKPPPIYVYTEPKVVGAADTADVIIKHRLEDGTLEDFPPEQTFELSVIDGCANGNILVEDSIGVYFKNVLQPVRLVTADSLDSDTGYVRLSVGTDLGGSGGPGGTGRPVIGKNVEEKNKVAKEIYKLVGDLSDRWDTLRAGYIKMISEKKSKRLAKENKREGEPLIEAPIIAACYIGDHLYEENYWEGDIPVKGDESTEILLGETKYYQAKYPDPLSNRLVIEEVKPGADGVPLLNGGLPLDVWGSDPVNVVECDTCSKKMGVYWGKKYPTNDFVEEKIPGYKKKFKLVEMKNLTPGVIRLVGRYWSPDSTYIVNLKAKNGNDSTEIKIIVINPGKLLSSGQSSSFEKARDVMDREINVDSLCILFGGMYGIPPQFIKGQMKTESATKTFVFDDGTTGKGFAPSYRFEPFTEQYNDNLRTSRDYNSFFIFDSAYTFSDVPTNHSHIRYINYPTSIKTVWDMIKEYSKLVDPNPSVNYYGGRDNNTHRVWFGYTIIDTVYTNRAELIRKSKPNWSDVQVYDSTNKYMIEYLQSEWKNPKSSLSNKGTIKNIAQTRVASSYGLAQFLYGTARDRDYSKEAVPENINLIDYIELFYKTEKKYLRDGLGSTVESGNNWNSGYDYSFCRKIYVPKWNSDPEYAKTLIINSKLFLPQK